MDLSVSSVDGTISTRCYSRFDPSKPAIASFVRESLSGAGIVGARAGSAIRATLHAFSLFAHMGRKDAKVSVSVYGMDGDFFIELGDGVDPRTASPEELPLVSDLDLWALFGSGNDVQIGHDDGHSYVLLKILAPTSQG